MTGRDKIEAAFSAEGAREFAAVIPYEDLYIRDNWDVLTSHPWWWAHELDIDRQLAWRSDVAAATGQDWINTPGFSSREDRQHKRIESTQEGMFLVDDRSGARKKLEPPVVSGQGGPASKVFRPHCLPESEEEIDRLIQPVTVEQGPAVATDGSDDLAKAVLAGFGKDLYPHSRISSPLWSCYGLFGFEGLMVTIATNPHLVELACERLLTRAVNAARRAAALGSKAVWIEECFTDQIGPDAFASLNVPFMTELVRAIQSLGMKAIYYYCGDPTGKWDHIFSVGADALSLEESKKGFAIDLMEVAEVVRARCVLLGNLDAIGIIENGTDDELRAAIEHQIAAGRMNGGRFIMSLGSPVPPGVPPSRVRLYCNLTRELSGR